MSREETERLRVFLLELVFCPSPKINKKVFKVQVFFQNKNKKVVNLVHNSSSSDNESALFVKQIRCIFDDDKILYFDGLRRVLLSMSCDFKNSEISFCTKVVRVLL